MKRILKKYLLTGLLVVLPAALTYIVLAFVVNGADGIAEQFLLQLGVKFHVPGLGFAVIFLFIFLVGLLGSNIVGAKLLAVWDFLVNKIPFVRGIYVNSKKVVDAISQSKEPLFKKLALVEFSEGARAVGIVCCNTRGEIAHRAGSDLVNVFVLSTPNITTGYLLFVSREQVTLLDMSVDEGLVSVISLGAVTPH